MDIEMVMPQLGESIAEGTVSAWLKSEGEAVHRDEAVVAVSTDKADVEVPAPTSGTLAKILVPAGRTVPVGTPLAVISAVKENQAIASELPPVEARQVTMAPPRHEVPHEERPPAVAASTQAPAAPAPEGPSERFQPAATASALQTAAALPHLTPIVLRLIRENNLDPNVIQGTGTGGRITREDVLRHIRSRQSEEAPGVEKPEPHPQKAAAVEKPKAAGESTAAAVSAPVAHPPAEAAPSESDEVIKLSPMRRRIAERLSRSKSEIPHVTTMLDVDMSRLVSLRAEHKAGYEKDGIRLTYMAFILKAVAEALKEFPTVNASWGGDSIILHRSVHLGVAVSLEKGLVVPVIRDADRKSVRELARSVQDVAARARAGRLTAEALQGSTFTVTNPGSFGGMLSTPIINPPEAAILAVERIAQVPVVRDGQVCIASMMNLCLSYDHRIIDGETAIGLLQAIRRRLEEAAFEM